VTHKSRLGRKAYLFVIAGSLVINGIATAAGDQARIADEPELSVRAKGEVELILLDLP
jgi:redox-sensitive bicupin YhaK (pirin superfamily)